MEITLRQRLVQQSVARPWSLCFQGALESTAGCKELKHVIYFAYNKQSMDIEENK